MTALIDQGDLETRVGAATVVQFTDDDGDGVADAATITWLLDTSSRIAEGILLKGYPSTDSIALLVGADPALLNDVVEIACGLMGGRRSGLLGPDGKVPYDGWRERACKRLQDVATAAIRSAGESAGGMNQILKTRVTPKRDMIFAATRDKPNGSGGF